MHRRTTAHSISTKYLRHAIATALCVVLLVALQAENSPALSAALAPASEEQREQRFQELSSRLDLTEDQEPQVRSILADDRETRLSLLRENGVDLEAGDKPSMFTMMGMRSDMMAINEQTRGELSTILSDDQMDTYDTIASERRAQMRASMGF
ncbi:MAG: hypothetical protein HEP70_12580 [Rhodobiaceae bacterium]|nr:hypothetical protein [Rhodobiaceae bacterium]